MSALGQKQTLRSEIAMSALPPKADIAEREEHVRFAPLTDISTLIGRPPKIGSAYELSVPRCC
jgi:hypothetical protein